MKRLLRWVGLLVLIAMLAYLGYYFFWPQITLKATGLVPRGAVMILESREPIGSWRKLSQTALWQHLTGHPAMAELNAEAESLDSLIADNAVALRLFGDRPLSMSMHLTRGGEDFGFLYYVDLGREAKIAAFEDALLPVFTTAGYTSDSRPYKQTSILRLQDRETGGILYMSFLDNILTMSYAEELLKAAINQRASPAITKEPHFQTLRKTLPSGEMFRLYFQTDALKDFLLRYAPGERVMLSGMQRVMNLAGMAMSLEDSTLRLNGKLMLREDEASYLHAMAGTGTGERHAADIIPRRSGLYFSMQFEDFPATYEAFVAQLKQDSATYRAYRENLKPVEGYLGIDLQEDFFRWIGEEIALVLAEPRVADGKPERLLVIHTNDAQDAREGLSRMMTKIRRKTPVKFKPVAYKDYTIHKFHVKNFFGLFLGKLFDQFEKPYFTQVGDFVVFSNRLRHLQYFLDDLTAGSTLANKAAFEDFSGRFGDEGHVFAYVNSARFLPVMRGFVDAETWQDIRKNEQYFAGFRHLGLQLRGAGQHFDLNMRLGYSGLIPEELGLAPEDLRDSPAEAADSGAKSLEEDTPPADEPPQDGRYVEKHGNGNAHIEAYYVDGQLSGDYREYYRDGDLERQGRYVNGKRHGKWFFYRRNGELRAVGKFRHGERIGTWLYYNRSGEVKDREQFSDPALAP